MNQTNFRLKFVVSDCCLKVFVQKDLRSVCEISSKPGFNCARMTYCKIWDLNSKICRKRNVGHYPYDMN